MTTRRRTCKEAATNNDIKVCYDRIPKSAVKSELSENSETKWQIEWDRTTKGVTTKLYFPKVADRLKLKISVTPNLTMMVTGHGNINPLTPNDLYSGRTAPLASKCCILYIYSTNTGTEYFKRAIYCPFFSLQNAVCFIILTYLVPVLFTFYIQSVLKFKIIIPALKD